MSGGRERRGILRLGRYAMSRCSYTRLRGLRRSAEERVRASTTRYTTGRFTSFRSRSKRIPIPTRSSTWWSGLTGTPRRTLTASPKFLTISWTRPSLRSTPCILLSGSKPTRRNSLLNMSTFMAPTWMINTSTKRSGKGEHLHKGWSRASLWPSQKVTTRERVPKTKRHRSLQRDIVSTVAECLNWATNRRMTRNGSSTWSSTLRRRIKRKFRTLQTNTRWILF